MKPETPLPIINPEQLSVPSGQNVEKIPTTDNLELGNTKGIDAYEKKSELNSAMADLGSSTALQLPVGDSQVTIGSTMVAGNPLIANDDDLIEKKWVEKAKKILIETQNNPYKRDNEVNKLQVDYLKKRFGRELGVAE